MSDRWKTLKEFFSDFVEIAKNSALVTQNIVLKYVGLLRKCFGGTVILIIILAAALYLGAANSFLLPLLVLCAIGSFVVLVILLSPFIWAGQLIYDRFPSIQRTTKTIAAVTFWAMLLPLTCLQQDVQSHPETFLLLIAIVSALSLGSFAGIVWWPKWFGKGLLSVQLIIVLLLTILTIKFPNTANALRWGSSWADIRMGRTLAQPIDEKVFDDPDHLVFVTAAGDPALFGVRSGDGWILSDRPGFHRSGLELKPIVDQSDRDAIYTWVGEQKQKRLARVAEIEAAASRCGVGSTEKGNERTRGSAFGRGGSAAGTTTAGRRAKKGGRS